ncbi:arrestin-C-like [Brienomyrus brachyistius]|uniref:arrestin-C-like n=1 Tax=Brienomyrus brachyistius TaxID=42636 RepID=UPI0020B380EF|nr:arrestin-C-like [Brienomyrus brachyistius]
MVITHPAMISNDNTQPSSYLHVSFCLLCRVFRKISANGSISLYLDRRDFVDHMDTVDIVDGVVKVDPAELKGRKVLVQLSCAFHYGQNDLDMTDLSFKRHIRSQTMQVYSATGEADLATTPTQEILMKKAGDQGQPFTFTLRKGLPCSVSIQPTPRHAGKGSTPDTLGPPCGVDFEVKAYIGNEQDGLKEKEDNIDQVHGNTISEVYQVTPLLANNKDKLGLALDGKLKDEDTNLASTTLQRPAMDKEILGILVSYKISVGVLLYTHGLLGDITARDVSVELPPVLMSPKPAGENLSWVHEHGYAFN